MISLKIHCTFHLTFMFNCFAMFNRMRLAFLKLYVVTFVDSYLLVYTIDVVSGVTFPSLHESPPALRVWRRGHRIILLPLLHIIM